MMTTRFSHQPTARRILFLAWLFLFSVLCLPPVSAQTPPANRWLLVIETSRAMQPRAGAVAQSVNSLLLSGMKGQMRAGDSLGLWTFNNELHVGEFPLQTWSPESSKAIAERVALFLAQQKFEKRTRRDQVYPAMNGVISNSPFITVILISSGGETATGTPFDKAITAIHSRWQSQQEQARQPFLTMLRAQRGRITDYEVNLPPFPLEFPPLPPELKVTKPVEGKPVVVIPPSPPPPPAAVVPNLIVRGKKPEPPPVVLETVTNPPPAMPLPTNAVPVVEIQTNPPTPAPVPTVPAVTDPAPAITNPATNEVFAAAAATNPPVLTVTPKEPAPEKTSWLAGLIAAGAALGLVIVLVRRARSRPRVSLITRSLDRDKK